MSTVLASGRSLIAKIAKVVSGAADVHKLIGEIRGRLKDIDRAARDVCGLLPPDDVKRNVIPKLVKRMGERWADEYGRRLVHDLAEPTRRGEPMMPELSIGFIAWADPDWFTEMLSGVVDKVPYNPGPPAIDRPEIKEHLDKERAELEAAEVRIIDEAVALGVTIAHRPEVVQRRANETRARELEEQRVADRRRRQRELDERHALTKSRGESAYLAAQRARVPPTV